MTRNRVNKRNAVLSLGRPAPEAVLLRPRLLHQTNLCLPCLVADHSALSVGYHLRCELCLESPAGAPLHVAPPRPASARGARAATTTAAAVAAGEEGDENAEEGDNGVDDGVEDVADATDDGHDTVTDGTEETRNARDDGTHFDRCVW